MERLAGEPDYGLRIAYASALGHLAAAEAAEQMLDLLRNSEEEITRLELALALARILGEEHLFIRLVRQVRSDTGTAVAQELEEFQKRLELLAPGDEELRNELEGCANAFAHNDLEIGAALLSQFLRRLPLNNLGGAGIVILEEAASYLAEQGVERLEYLLLALHVLQARW
jgi:HEAT repeat protein